MSDKDTTPRSCAEVRQQGEPAGHLESTSDGGWVYFNSPL